jgi:hypothetical protein
VTVKATPATDLATPDAHHWGNALGDSGDSPTETAVNVIDALGVQANPHSLLTPAPIDDTYDHNRDKQVNLHGELIVRPNSTALLTDLNLLELRGSGGDEARAGEGESSGDARTTSAIVRVSGTSAVLQRDVAPGTVAVDTGIVLPVASSAALISSPVAAFDRRMTKCAGGTIEFASPTAWSSLPDSGLAVRRESAVAAEPSWDPALSRSSDADSCPVGRVKEASAHIPKTRSRWAPDLRGAKARRMLDRTLLQLLAECEQH